MQSEEKKVKLAETGERRVELNSSRPSFVLDHSLARWASLTGLYYCTACCRPTPPRTRRPPRPAPSLRLAANDAQTPPLDDQEHRPHETVTRFDIPCMQRVTTLAGPPAAAKAFGGARGVPRRRRLASLVCLGAVDCLNGPPSSESLPAECFPIAFAVVSTTPCPRLCSLRLRQQIRLSFASRPKESASSASPAPLKPGYGCTLYTPTRIHTIAIAFCFRAHAPLSSPPPCFKHSTPYCPFPDDRRPRAPRERHHLSVRSRSIRNLRLDTRDWNATRSHSVPTTGPRRSFRPGGRLSRRALACFA